MPSLLALITAIPMARAADAPDLPATEQVARARAEILARHVPQPDPARIPSAPTPSRVDPERHGFYARVHVDADPGLNPAELHLDANGTYRVLSSDSPAPSLWECVSDRDDIVDILTVRDPTGSALVNLVHGWAVRAGAAAYVLQTADPRLLEGDPAPPTCLAWSDAPARGCTTLSCGDEVVHACGARSDRYRTLVAEGQGTGLTERLNDAAWRAPGGIRVELDAMNVWGSTLADLDSDGVYERLDWEHSKRMPSCAMGMRDDPMGSLTPVVTGVFHWRAHRWVRARRGLHAPFFRHAWAAALRGALDDVPSTDEDEPVAPAGEYDTLLRLAEAGVPLRDAAGWIAAAYAPERREDAARCAREAHASTTDPWTLLTRP